MKKLKFLSKEEAEELIEIIDDYLDYNYILTGKEIDADSYKSYSELRGNVKEKPRIICQKCNKNKGRFRKSTNDYRCENCKEVFKI